MPRRTSSLWGYPPTRYFNFLRRVESSFDETPLSLAVLGCSDGKFVLPAARRGYRVLALDTDTVALYGGEKQGPSGTVYMPGLTSRLTAENLSTLVEVVNTDFVEYHTPVQYHAVFTSGALQYSRNMKHSMADMVNKVKEYVLDNGFLYIDYMLPMESKYQGRDNYPDRDQWNFFFQGGGWKVYYNRVLPPVFEAAHVDNPVDHYHHWGHLLAKRQAGTGNT